jgi:hypothetical protein
VSARPARPLPPEFSCLADPAWLLGAYRLQAGGETEVGGRRGLVAAGRWHQDGEPPGVEYFWPGSPAEQVEAVVDTELAVLLRLTGFIGGQPVICYEVRGRHAGVANARAFDVPPGAHSRGPLNRLGLTRPGRPRERPGWEWPARPPWSAGCRSAPAADPEPRRRRRKESSSPYVTS